MTVPARITWSRGKKTEIPLDEWRSMLQCSPAQMRIALHRMGHLETVQAIADADPEAGIVWEYATVIYRTSPLISALGAQAFTDEQIDAMFTSAMEVDL